METAAKQTPVSATPGLIPVPILVSGASLVSGFSCREYNWWSLHLLHSFQTRPSPSPEQKEIRVSCNSSEGQRSRIFWREKAWFEANFLQTWLEKTGMKIIGRVQQARAVDSVAALSMKCSQTNLSTHVPHARPTMPCILLVCYRHSRRPQLPGTRSHILPSCACDWPLNFCWDFRGESPDDICTQITIRVGRRGVTTKTTCTCVSILGLRMRVSSTPPGAFRSFNRMSKVTYLIMWRSWKRDCGNMVEQVALLPCLYNTHVITYMYVQSFYMYIQSLYIHNYMYVYENG